jgi:hypothetical protein
MDMTYSCVCVCVEARACAHACAGIALLIQYAKCTRQIVICGISVSTKFLDFISQRAPFFFGEKSYRT